MLKNLSPTTSTHIVTPKQIHKIKTKLSNQLTSSRGRRPLETQKHKKDTKTQRVHVALLAHTQKWMKVNREMRSKWEGERGREKERVGGGKPRSSDPTVHSSAKQREIGCCIAGSTLTHEASDQFSARERWAERFEGTNMERNHGHKEGAVGEI